MEKLVDKQILIFNNLQKKYLLFIQSMQADFGELIGRYSYSNRYIFLCLYFLCWLSCHPNPMLFIVVAISSLVSVTIISDFKVMLLKREFNTKLHILKRKIRFAVKLYELFHFIKKYKQKALRQNFYQIIMWKNTGADHYNQLFYQYPP